MFAIVEFDNSKKEFFVVPLLWLTDEKKQCLWPPKHAEVEELIKSMSAPLPSWKSFAIKKVHDTGGNT